MNQTLGDKAVPPASPERGETLTNEDELKRRELEKERKVKNQYFGQYPDSPIPTHERPSFAGLNYYPVDPKFRFKVRLQKHDRPEHVSLITSTGTTKDFIRVGFFEFSIAQGTCRLEVYKPALSHEAEESLFIPFKDRTSGIESYGAGRYVDIPENEKGIYELDFNKAYNPYCAYSTEYVCPLPPTENWLDVEIRAGERVYRN